MNKIKKDIEFIGLSYQKEMIKLVVINVLLILLDIVTYLFLDQLYITIGIGVGLILINYLYLSSYSSKKDKLIEEREDEFIQMITYFQIFISNNMNVYHAFESLIHYSSPWMANEIEYMLNEIDNDKSVKPFVNFAHKFKSTIIENIMLSIYQMVEEGESLKRLSQFTLLFDDFSKTHKKEKLDLKVKSLETINMFPLIGSGFIAVILTFGVMSIIGELINGI